MSITEKTVLSTSKYVLRSATAPGKQRNQLLWDRGRKGRTRGEAGGERKKVGKRTSRFWSHFPGLRQPELETQSSACPGQERPHLAARAQRSSSEAGICRGSPERLSSPVRAAGQRRRTQRF